ncbi:cupin domain-containing protein [Lichenihabitans psoromatis]|uniref:cupin domain-containing protein n=1 Tax=Lichenihabitans psoromatis TaxID=2528642 RepID=UPI001FE1E46C|nr:cupin domain-containing protein [Lichenihabitans psoromatis]
MSVVVSPVPIAVAKTGVPLTLAPIVPEWVVSGAPVARNAILSHSKDWTAFTMEWDCTTGEFDWFYDLDETVHILEGSVILDDGHGPARHLGVGDIVFFPAGSRVRWRVETYVHKLAFFRQPFPKAMSFGLKVTRRLNRMARSAMGRAPASSGKAKGVA